MPKDLEMKPVADDPTDPDPHALDNMTDAEIEAALNPKAADKPAFDPLSEEEDEKPAGAPPETDIPSEGDKPAEVGEPAPSDLPEIDEVELARREGEAQRERLQAQLDLQKAHGSRLAGEIGSLKKALQTRQEPERDTSEVYGGDGESALARRLDQIEVRLQSEARRQGIMEELNSLSSMPELKEINDQHLAKATQVYAEDLKTVNEIEDPTIARQMARAVIKNVVAEARGFALAELRDQMSKRSVTQKADLIAGKRAAGPTTSVKSSAGNRPRAKTLDEMSDAEIERMTDEAVARSA